MSSIELVGIGNEPGFVNRVHFFVGKKVMAVLANSGAPVAEIALAKSMVTASSEVLARRFAQAVLHNAGVRSDLDLNGFDHLKVTDINLEAAVNAAWVLAAVAVT